MGRSVRAARLTAELVANASPFEAGLKKASFQLEKTNTSWKNTVGRFEREALRAGKGVNNLGDSVDALGGSFRSLGSIVAGAFSVEKIIAYSDIWKQIEGRIGVVTSSTQEAAVRQEQLFDIAQKTGQEYEGLVNLYARLSQALSPAQKAQTDLLAVTDTFSRALVVTGESAEAARGAIIQFSQGITSDFKSSGQELNSIIEQAPRAAQAIARFYGTTTGGLKRLAEDGKISASGVLQALTNESAQIAAESDKLLNTVGRSLTRLDNAFLKYIGQSAAANQGTTSLALALNKMAENFDAVADGLTLVATIFGLNLLRGLVAARVASLATAVAFTATATAATVFGARAAALGVVAATASTRMALLAATTRVVGANMLALVGGPIGVLVLSLYGLKTAFDTYNTMGQSIEQTNKKIGDTYVLIKDRMEEYKTASNERRKVIVSDIEQEIVALQNQVVVYSQLLAQLQSESAFSKFIRTGGGSLAGLDIDARNAQAAINDLNSAIIASQAAMRGLSTSRQGALGGSSSGAGSKQSDREKEAERYLESLDKAIEALDRESITLTVQTRMYGQKAQAIERVLALENMAADLAEQQGKLTDAEMAKAREQIALIAQQLELRERQKDILEQTAEQAKRVEEALKEVGDAFESAFESAIIEGNNLRDVMGGLLKDIAAMLLRKTVTEPLGNAFSSVLGNVFGSLGGSFNGGTDFVPRDMTARIHKGEAVLSAEDAEMWRNGGGQGGNVYQIDARGADVGAVMRVEQALLALAGPGVIERRVSSASARGSL